MANKKKKEDTTGYNTVSFVCGLVGMFIFPLILGCCGLAAYNKADEDDNVNGLGTAGKVLSIVDLCFAAIRFVCILVAIGAYM